MSKSDSSTVNPTVAARTNSYSPVTPTTSIRPLSKPFNAASNELTTISARENSFSVPPDVFTTALGRGSCTESAGSKSSDLLDMESAHSVQSTPAAHEKTPASKRGSSRRSILYSRSSFFRSSSLLRAPPDLAKIREYLSQCITPNNRIQIRLYIQAYKEIVKFLCALGTILSFASRDIDSKVSRMDELLQTEDKTHYLFLDDLLKFEIEKGLVSADGTELAKHHKAKRSGTRIMFRLHQAMAFLVQFFTNVRDQPTAKMHAIVNEAYKETISKNHSWLVRKTATLAFYAIPSRNTLIGRMAHEDVPESALMEELKDIIDVAIRVYVITGSTFNCCSSIAAKEPKYPVQSTSNACNTSAKD